MAFQFIRWTGACVAGFALASVAAPAFGQITLQNEKQGEDKVNAVHTEAVGPKCVPGKDAASGMVVCPTVKFAGNANTVRNIVGEAKGRKIKLAFCVSERGDPAQVEVVESTGKPKVDREMAKFIRTWSYNPGTIDGRPAELCGVQADFLF